MNGKHPRFALCIVTLALTACGTGDVMPSIDSSKPHIAVTLVYNTDAYKSMMMKKFYPSYAVWVVEPKSGEARTVYVTGKAGKNKWIMAKERPSSLPVWFGIRDGDRDRGRVAAIDAVTGATPSGKEFTHTWNMPSDMLNKKLEVYIEGNVSFDFNEHYKKAKKGEPGFSDVNGQPSLVWKTTIDTSKGSAESAPVLTGHGHVLGEDHAVNPDLSTITTAKNIFQYMVVSYNPGIKK